MSTKKQVPKIHLDSANGIESITKSNNFFRIKKNAFTYVIAILCGLTLVSSCDKNDDNDGPLDSTRLGFIYTTTNGQQGNSNQVIKLERFSDGSLKNEVAYNTNSAGGANIAAGGDAHGDFDAEGGLQIIGDYMLCVNAGGHQISVFKIDKPTGNLTLMNNVSSGGMRPTSITFTPKSGSSTDYWVVVGNQWNNPNVQKDGASIERYPNDAFHMANLTLPDASDADRNITLFSFNSNSGNLTQMQTLDNFNRENGGPTRVLFSEDGTKLAVATWGIAHFGTMMPSLAEQHSSRVYMYDFNNGSVSNPRFFEESGIAGTIGLTWAKGSNNTLFASNFNVIPAKSDNGLTVLTDNGSSVSKSANYKTGFTPGDEACWTELNPQGNILYVASFTGNVISAFGASGGGITSQASVSKRGGFSPPGDSKDVYVTPDNKYLYNLGAFQSFSVLRFKIAGSTTVYESQYTLKATELSVGTAGTYNFLGITGYDL